MVSTACLRSCMGRRGGTRVFIHVKCQGVIHVLGWGLTFRLLCDIATVVHVYPDMLTPILRFNQTVKAMLRRVADDEGKDWDQFLPYLLFAYREVPRASTGFSPFELLYGRQVRGPLDVLRETWEVRKTSKESVVSYVLAIQDRLMK